MPGMLLLHIQRAHCNASTTDAKPPVFATLENRLAGIAKLALHFKRKPADKRAYFCKVPRPAPATPRCVSDRNHCFPAMGAGCFNGVVKPGAGGVARAYGADGVLWAHATRKGEFSWHKFLILTVGRFFRGQALRPVFSLQAL